MKNNIKLFTAILLCAFSATAFAQQMRMQHTPTRSIWLKSYTRYDRNKIINAVMDEQDNVYFIGKIESRGMDLEGTLFCPADTLPSTGLISSGNHRGIYIGKF